MMKRLFQKKYSSGVAILLLLFCFQKAFSQTDEPFSNNQSPLPAPTGFVNDYAGVIDAGIKQSLEQKITNLKNRTNPPVELAVAVVRTTGDRPIFDYSLAVARGWGIGSKDTDNPSALLFIAIDDRKYFTQVSRDLEDELPDGLVGQLQRQYLVPEFKKGNYSKGIEDTIDAYIQAIENRTSGSINDTSASPTPSERNRNSKGAAGIPVGCLCFIIFAVFILFSIIKSFFGGGRGGRGGRGGGGSGLGSALPWIIGSAIANSSRGGSSWGGSSSGWSSGGSSGGWGGFGGGGDFGGGGAGGSW